MRVLAVVSRSLGGASEGGEEAVVLHREGGQDRGKEGRGEEPVVVGGTGGGRGRRVSEEESSEVHMEGGTGQ